MTAAEAATSGHTATAAGPRGNTKATAATAVALAHHHRKSPMTIGSTTANPTRTIWSMSDSDTQPAAAETGQSPEGNGGHREPTEERARESVHNLYATDYSPISQ